MNHYVRTKGRAATIFNFASRLREARIPFVVTTVTGKLSPWNRNDVLAREWWSSRRIIRGWSELRNDHGQADLTFWIRERDYPLVATMAPSRLEKR